MTIRVPLFIDELLAQMNPTIIRCLGGHIRHIECKNTLLNFHFFNLTTYPGANLKKIVGTVSSHSTSHHRRRIVVVEKVGESP
jgi:hypothetical protein